LDFSDTQPALLTNGKEEERKKERNQQSKSTLRREETYLFLSFKTLLAIIEDFFFEYDC
jgi:hypothetical protein